MLTLLMCGLVLGFYASHQDKLKGSLVSPLAVIEVSDELEIFEMREMELILSSLEKSGMDKDAFESEFVSGINESMSEFVFSDLTLNGVEIVKESDKETLLEKGLYSVREESGNLVLKRLKIGKRILLKASREEDVEFPIEFVFEFEREYLIEKNGNKFSVEKA